MNIDLLIKDSFMIPLEILEICKKKKKNLISESF